MQEKCIKWLKTRAETLKVHKHTQGLTCGPFLDSEAMRLTVRETSFEGLTVNTNTVNG